MLFTTTSWAMRHYTTTVSLDPIQLNIDSFIIMSAMTFILWGIFLPTFRVFDILEGILCSLLSLVGNISLTKALQSGKGGPVQAIESLKSLVVLGFGIITKGYVPTYLQITGVALGITGASIVGLYKKK